MRHEDSIAVASVDNLTFIFIPTVCDIGDEDVVIAASGANDANGEPAHLSVDLRGLGTDANGTVRITLGTDEASASSDTFYASELPTTGDHSVGTGSGMADFLEFEADFTHADGTPAGTGHVQAECA